MWSSVKLASLNFYSEPNIKYKYHSQSIKIETLGVYSSGEGKVVYDDKTLYIKPLTTVKLLGNRPIIENA